MRLRDLLRDVLEAKLLATLPELVLSELQLDSRRCVAGSAFVAVPGLTAHGAVHAAAAVAKGATVVLWQPDDAVSMPELSVPVIAVPNLKQQLPLLAQRLYGDAASLRIVGVTGTNGKSTTAFLIAQAAELCGLPAGYIGTVGCGRVQHLQPTSHTTADVLSVYRQLQQLRDAGATVVAMEVSSHALHQQRIAGLSVDTAVFTNLTQDHLDYHGTMQAYGAAKALLFQWPGLKTQVINVDDAFGRVLLTIGTAANSLSYSCEPQAAQHANLHAEVSLSMDGLWLQVMTPQGAATINSPLLGRFNAENLLAALGVLLSWQVPLTQAAQALARCVAPPGRMELLRCATQRAVVDYAHTPDALQKALQVLKVHTTGKLICVFGCGGDRDAGKRPQMGRIAETFADVVILTDDNPRTEDPQQIIADIRRGMQRTCLIERDRAQAIKLALLQAAANDIVLIAGKGHEDYQIIGKETRHFSDREVVQQIFRSAA